MVAYSKIVPLYSFQILGALTWVTIIENLTSRELHSIAVLAIQKSET